MLTTDVRQLPDEVREELADFYRIKLNWLSSIFMLEADVDDKQAQVKASQMLASLHGASILVQATGDVEKYEDAVGYLR